ncbi:MULTISPECIES: hypothetical protein [Ralstonia]|uniref:Uncharacterized protein n=2 Tax=Ralstonia pickettii TaxID=329 RepID=R0CN59_RALPI|nr:MULTISPECIES: hypothetical protein [Ralstonia]ENZ77920.1 hypothetical protein OR214_02196 [Ralstonia pickettii OR214]MCM3581982.1 hypothetical protein [Ralstonia pickettii]
MTHEYLCEHAQLDPRSVPAQLRGHGDGRDELYELFLRVEGIGNSLADRDGVVVDSYAEVMEGRTFPPAIAWFLIRFGRMLAKLDVASRKLKHLADSCDFDPPASGGRREENFRHSYV